MFDVAQFCEIAMLCTFGVSWPFNIAKSIQSRTAKGKSVLFEILVVSGYCLGMFSKIWTWTQTGTLAYSVWFYVADIAMVCVDLVLYARNVKLDKIRDIVEEDTAEAA